MKAYYNILANNLMSGLASVVIWFATMYWSYLQTGSVLTTSIMSGIYLVLVALSGFWFGSIVDHNKKKRAMLMSSAVTILCFASAFLIYLTAPENAFTTVASVWLWSLITLVLVGVVFENVRMISISTLTTVMVEADRRDKMNGLVGTVNGVTFMVSNIVSGFSLAFAGMFWVLSVGLGVLVLAFIHLSFIQTGEKEIAHVEGAPKNLDIKGTIAIIRTIPGLFPLIFFTTFNNFLGGVFMPLMDPYGLSLVSLQVWATLWAFLSSGFIIGGLIIAKKGLGKNPLITLFRVNIILWLTCIFMAIQPSIVLLAVCMLIWLTVMPFVEATEQTIIQKVVPVERQGRVFGFAQSIEQAASPITAFMIGPIAQFIFIPFMTTGKGVELIGSWFGVGAGRGIALVFITSGIIGLCVTLVAMRSRSYKLLGKRYQENPTPVEVVS